jgi:hypothetical protein
MQSMQFQTPKVEKKGGGGFLGLGKLLKTIAPLAHVIPGVGTLASIGIQAAATGLGTAMEGGNLISGAVGGATSAATGVGMGAIGEALGITRPPTPSEAGREGYFGIGQARAANEGIIDEALGMQGPPHMKQYTQSGAPSVFYGQQYRGVY